MGNQRTYPTILNYKFGKGFILCVWENSYFMFCRNWLRAWWIRDGKFWEELLALLSSTLSLPLPLLILTSSMCSDCNNNLDCLWLAHATLRCYIQLHSYKVEKKKMKENSAREGVRYKEGKARRNWYFTVMALSCNYLVQHWSWVYSDFGQHFILADCKHFSHLHIRSFVF